MAEGVRMWAVLNPKGKLMDGTVSAKRVHAIDAAFHEDVHAASWEQMREDGYRAVRVTVTVEEEDDG